MFTQHETLIIVCVCIYIYINIYINSYEDNPYNCRNKPELVVEKLKDDANIIFKLVNDNALKATPDKFHLPLNSNNNEIYIDIDNHRIYNSPHEKLLGIYIY